MNINILCSPREMCALKLVNHQLIPPGRENLMPGLERTDLQQMYDVLYGVENVIMVPFKYIQFNQTRIFEQIYTSSKSRTSRSSVVIAVWPHSSSILSSNPTMNDVQVGTIEYILLHTPTIKIAVAGDSATTENKYITTKQDHLLARMKWYQDHPQKFHMNNGIVLSATVTEPLTSSSFMPVSRIISRCAVLSTEIQFDYDAHKVCIAVPLRRHYLF